MKNSLDKLLATGALAVSLTACGGGGSSSSPAPEKTLSKQEVISTLSQELANSQTNVTFDALPQTSECLVYGEKGVARNTVDYTGKFCFTEDYSGNPDVSPDVDVFKELPQDVTKKELSDYISNLRQSSLPPVFGKIHDTVEYFQNTQTPEFELNTRSQNIPTLACELYDSSDNFVEDGAIVDKSGVDYVQFSPGLSGLSGEIYTVECSAQSDLGEANQEFNFEYEGGSIN